MKKFFFLFLLGTILTFPIFSQTDFPEISKDELENYEYQVIYEEPEGTYKIIIIDGVTYIVYY